jgi:hypothetical protein
MIAAGVQRAAKSSNNAIRCLIARGGVTPSLEGVKAWLA